MNMRTTVGLVKEIKHASSASTAFIAATTKGMTMHLFERQAAVAIVETRRHGVVKASVPYIVVPFHKLTTHWKRSTHGSSSVFNMSSTLSLNTFFCHPSIYITIAFARKLYSLIHLRDLCVLLLILSNGSPPPPRQTPCVAPSETSSSKTGHPG